MSRERNAELERLFDELTELEPSARAERIRTLTDAGTVLPAVLQEAASLLDAADRAGDFLGIMNAGRGVVGHGPGDLIGGRFRIRGLIGEGATGDVYLATDEQLERQVALKFWRGATVSGRAGFAHFVAEARAAAKLEHRHVATVHDVGESDGRPFIAMAYYPGATLRDRIASGDIRPSDALRIAAQIASALNAAHAAGIVHRDVKPANVLFEADGSVRLADFGAVRLIASDPAAERDVAIGTIAYMSPEQARGEVVDNRADLWALGVIMYEMLTGRRPFTAVGPAELLRAIANDAPATMPDNVDAPVDIRELIASLLSREPSERPRDASDIVRVLEQSLVDRNVVERESRVVRGGTLPSPVTSFVGREREMALGFELLQRTRLLTLTGPGGTGKTRLSLELAAARSTAFRDGVWFVPLAEIANPALVPSIVAQVVGIRDFSGEDLGRRVINTLRRRHLMLVLDNFEHVMDATPFVSHLLAECADVSIMVTSRIPLGAQGEQELPVPPLGTPSMADPDASNSESVQLFVQRARAARPDFTLTSDGLRAVAEICRRLDGIPLALELAAARARLLSPRAMLSRLEHRFDLLRTDSRAWPVRHATMHNVIEWSYVLLTDSERALFNRLAFFAGGFTIEAAVAVAELADHERQVPGSTLDLLASLCNKSLLRQEEQPDGEPRFMMLEIVRQFALDRLRADGAEMAARRAHRSYYLSLAERSALELRGPSQADAFDRLAREYANCRVALDGALDELNDQTLDATQTEASSALEDAARLGIALHRLWMTRGPLLEGTEYLRRVTESADTMAAQTPARSALAGRLRAGLLSSAAQLANTRSVFPEAQALFARSLTLYRDAGDDAAAATALNNLAWSTWIIGDMRDGEAMALAAMSMHEKAGNATGVTLSRNTLGWIAMERGRYTDAETYFASSVAAHRESGDRRATAFTLGWIGVLAGRRGDFARAVQLHQQAIDMLESVADRGYRVLSEVRRAAALHAAQAAGDFASQIENVFLPLLREEDGRLWPLAYALTELGGMLRDSGELARARDVLVEAVDVRRQTGGMQGRAEARLLLGTVHHLMGDHDAARRALSSALSDALGFQAVPVAMDCIETIALVARDRDRYQAATLLGTTDEIRRAMGVPRAPRHEVACSEGIVALRASLGDREMERALSDGAARSLDDAAEIAIARVS